MNTIFWASDSTVQYNNIQTYPQTGMGQVLHLYLKPEIKVSNHAKNGRSTKSFMDEGRLQAIENEISEGDFLFIQFGHNDEKAQDPTRYADPDGLYVKNLETFIEVAQKKKAFPVLITPLARRCFREDGTLGPGEHGPYVASMKKTAERLHVPLIDLTDKSRRELMKFGPEESTNWYMHLPTGKYKNYPDGLTDNTHLKYDGAVRYAGLIAEGLQELGGIYSELIMAQE